MELIMKLTNGFMFIFTSSFMLMDLHVLNIYFNTI
jgi:hypothetical protein